MFAFIPVPVTWTWGKNYYGFFDKYKLKHIVKEEKRQKNYKKKKKEKKKKNKICNNIGLGI